MQHPFARRRVIRPVDSDLTRVDLAVAIGADDYSIPHGVFAASLTWNYSVAI